MNKSSNTQFLFTIFEGTPFFGTKEYSKQDKCWHGRIYGMKDLVTFEADEEEALFPAFEDAIVDYIDTIKRLIPDKNWRFETPIPLAAKALKESMEYRISVKETYVLWEIVFLDAEEQLQPFISGQKKDLFSAADAAKTCLDYILEH